MDSYTEKTRDWLEDRFQRGVAEDRYHAHRPIYGFGIAPSEPSHTARMALALAILRQLNTLNGTSMVDLGGGEGYIAALARDLLGYESMMVELPEAACQRSRELFGLYAQTADVHNLPFEDQSVDVTVLSEVIEHLSDPILALVEAWRISRHAVIVTTQEVQPWEWERKAHMKLRELERGHAERTYFHPHDFRAIFGRKVELLNPCLIIPLEDETKITAAEAKKLVPYLAQKRSFGPGSFGIMVVAKKSKNAGIPERISDSALIEGLFGFSVPLPNVSRANEVRCPGWYRERGSAETHSQPTESLSETWSEADRARIDRLRLLQGLPVAKGASERIAAKLTLAFSALLRLLLSPGTASLKFKWLAKAINLRTLRKALGG